jgi:hypothetical protein
MKVAFFRVFIHILVKEALFQWGTPCSKWNSLTEKFNYIIGSIAQYADRNPTDPIVQNLIAKWQSYITRNFFECTKEMLQYLGTMYVTDKRFEIFRRPRKGRRGQIHKCGN